jgi:Xaa-Pro aminopeptidase
MLNTQTYSARRNKLVQQMQRGIAVIPTAPEKIRNNDAHYSYRFDSYFYYLTGFTEPEAVLVVVAGSKPKNILFCREKNLEREIWDGFRYGPEAAREQFGFDEAYPIDLLDEKLLTLLGDQAALFYPTGMDSGWDRRLLDLINKVREKSRSGVMAPARVEDVRMLLDEMRLFKDAAEISTMRRAAEISSAAHIESIKKTKPGVYEYEIEAELLQIFRRSGSQAPAYTPIVAGGANACTLHYVANNAVLKDGDLLLIDAGCELDGYASDITRTFPVGKKFSGPQKALYEIVLAAQAAAIALVKPNQSWVAPHDAALKVLTQGFIDLGLCKGSLDAVLESGDYKRFYMHRTGHWLGLDVHDVGEYKKNGDWRALQPGMMLTVEPGCYIRPADNVSKDFWNIGIRIEDDVLVTAQGCEVISSVAPKTVADIEHLRNH